MSPGARRSGVAVDPDGNLRVRVGAPAREGKANRELLRFLAAALDLPPSAVRLVSGEGSRHKVVELTGLSREEAVRRLADGVSE